MTIDPKTIKKAVDAIAPGSCNCREGHNQHGYWRQVDMTCPHCGNSEAKARAVLEAVADDLRAEGAAKALREAAELVMGPSDYLADNATCRHIANELRAHADAIEAGQP